MGFALARVGAQLGAVHRNRAQFDQAALAGELDHLHEHRRQFLEVQRAKVAQRALLGEVARGQHPECHVLMQLPGNLARGENAAGVVVQAGILIARLEVDRELSEFLRGFAAGQTPPAGLLDPVSPLQRGTRMRQAFSTRSHAEPLSGGTGKADAMACDSGLSLQRPIGPYHQGNP